VFWEWPLRLQEVINQEERIKGKKTVPPSRELFSLLTIIYTSEPVNSFKGRKRNNRPVEELVFAIPVAGRGL
jgi:hypothetical protein